MKKKLTLCALLVPVQTVFADTTQLQEVVVTASGFQQSVRQAPASITVITQQELQKKPVNSVADALKDVEGIDVRASTGKTGGLNIAMRGMPSEYTLILIDGRRQNADRGVAPNGFDTANTNFLPPMVAIERIEVIRGPMSTLYGSDAMGGVINIITKKMPEQWSSNLNIGTLLQENRQAGNSQNVNLYTAGPLIDKTLSMALRASVYQRAESKLEASNNKDAVVNRQSLSPPQADVYTLGGRLNYQLNPYNSLWLDSDIARQTYDNGNSQLGTLDTEKKASGYKKTLRFQRTQYALGHEGKFDNGISVNSSVMFNETETVGRTIPTDAVPKGSPRAGRDRGLKTSNLVIDNKWVVPLFDVHKVTAGGQFIQAKLRDGLISDTYRQNSGSLFLEDEWFILDNLALTLGGRYEQHQTFSGHFSPRSYLVWDMSDDWTLKGG
ncbi:MAG: TonB-dependent receptor domain-containing protein [Enterobacteriaceae bacterium]